jgi:hypothetical protein
MGAHRTSREVLVRCSHCDRHGACFVCRATYVETYWLRVLGSLKFRHRNSFKGDEDIIGKRYNTGQVPERPECIAGQLIARTGGVLREVFRYYGGVKCQCSALRMRCRKSPCGVSTVSYGAYSIRRSVCRTLLVRSPSRNRTRGRIRTPLSPLPPVTLLPSGQQAAAYIVLRWSCVFDSLNPKCRAHLNDIE